MTISEQIREAALRGHGVLSCWEVSDAVAFELDWFCHANEWWSVMRFGTDQRTFMLLVAEALE